MESNKEYYAFISYKREDEKWAKWLQEKLEHYRFPTNLNGRTDLPKHIRPTFRDVTDLTPGLLAEEIDAALRNSEWLIVVCSPRSAKSPWVCKEAQTFIDLGRADHIIPFVIEGVPFSNDAATECYPEALLNLIGSKELLAANINEMGRDAAAIKIIARMFNLRFDALWQRFEREQRHKRWMWIGGSILFALFGLGIGAYFIKQNRTIENQNAQLENAANHLREDSVTLANHVLKIQADSIQLVRKNDSIQRQKDSLMITNRLLAEERDNVLRANMSMKENRGRFLADEIVRLTNDGDIYTAQRVGSELYADNNYLSGLYVPELENAIRNTYTSMTFQTDTTFSKSSPDLRKVPYTSLAILREHEQAVYNIGNVYEGKALITCDSKTICIIDNRTGKVLKKWNGYFLGMSNDGKFVAFQDGSNIYIKDMLSEKTHYTIVMPSEKSAQGMHIAFHPSNNIVVCFCYGWMGAFDITIPGEIEFEPNAKNTKLTSEFMESFCFDKNGDRLLMVPSNIIEPDSVIVLDLKNGIKHVINQNVSYATFYNDEIVTCDEPNNSITFWKFDGSKYLCREKIADNCLKSTSRIKFLSISPNNDYIALALDKSIRLWDIRKKKEVQKIDGHFDVVNQILFSSDGNRLFSCSSDNTVRVWTKENRIGDVIYNSKYISSLKSARYDNSSRYLVSIEEHYIRLWDVARRVEIWKREYSDIIFKFLEGFCLATFSNEGRYIVSVHGNKTDQTIQIWETTTGNIVNSFSCHFDKMNCVAFSQDDNLLATASDDNFIRIWEVKTGKLLKSIIGHDYLVESVEFSKDGRSLLSASCDHSVKLWDFRTGKEVMRYDGSLNHLKMATFSPDEKTIVACGNDKFIHLWNRESGKKIATFKGHTNTISSARFSPNGKFIVSSSWDGCIKVWDVSSQMEIMNYYVGSSFIYGSSFNTDGNKILYFCSGEIHEIDFLPFEQLTKRMQKQYHNNRLNEIELRKYYLK